MIHHIQNSTDWLYILSCTFTMKLMFFKELMSDHIHAYAVVVIEIEHVTKDEPLTNISTRIWDKNLFTSFVFLCTCATRIEPSYDHICCYVFPQLHAT